MTSAKPWAPRSDGRSSAWPDGLKILFVPRERRPASRISIYVTSLFAIPDPRPESPVKKGTHVEAPTAFRREDRPSRAIAFGELYREHYPQIAGYLYRRTGNRDVAEDLADNTFLDAYRSFGRFRTTSAPVSSWFYRIATNKANQWARRVRRAQIESPAPTQEPEETVLQREASEALYRAMHRLKPEHQEVIALLRFESMSHKEAAAVLRVRQGTIKSRLSRATQALKRELSHLGDEP